MFNKNRFSTLLVLVLLVFTTFGLTGCDDDYLQGIIDAFNGVPTDEQRAEEREQRREQEQAQQPQQAPVLQPQTPTSYDVWLTIDKFGAYNVEEDISGQDEVLMIITLSGTNLDGDFINTRVARWTRDVYAGDVFFTNDFPTVEFNNVPPDINFVVSVVAWDTEDYSTVQEIIGDIDAINGYVQWGNRFNPEPYSNRALAITGEVIKYSSKGVDLIDNLDDDDLLINFDFYVNHRDIEQMALVGMSSGGISESTGCNNGDCFGYVTHFNVWAQPNY